MTEETVSDEARLAKERIENLEKVLVRKRFISILLVLAGSLSGCIAIWFELPFVAFCLFVVSGLFLLRYFDSNGHLHEVRRRPTNSLFPRLSAAQAPRQSHTVTETGVRPEQ